MLSRKLMMVLRGLESSKMKRLHKFLLSPYFNDAYNAAQITCLFDYIRKYKAEEAHPKLTRALSFRSVFPTKVYTEGDLELDRLMSDLMNLVKTFLAQEKYQDESDKELAESLALASFYAQTPLPELFEKTIEQSRKTLQKRKIKDRRYYLDAFLLENEVSEFISTFDDFKGDSNLGITEHYLDVHYAITKMELACALKFRQELTTLDARFSLAFLNTLTEMIENKTIDHPILRGYYEIFKLLSSDFKEQDIIHLEALLLDIQKDIPFDKLMDMQTYIRSFWTKLYRTFRDKHYLEMLFAVYQKHLTEGFFYRNNKIMPMAVHNIVNIGLKLNAIDWIETFLNEHPPTRIQNFEQIHDVYNLNWANLYFYKKEYTKAEELLSYKFANVYYAAMANIILIKIYYEIDFPILEDKIAAFRVKLSRSTIPSERKQSFYNFLNRLTKIMELRLLKNNKSKIKLIESLEQQSNLVEKEWLIAKANT